MLAELVHPGPVWVHSKLDVPVNLLTSLCLLYLFISEDYYCPLPHYGKATKPETLIYWGVLVGPDRKKKRRHRICFNLLALPAFPCLGAFYTHPTTFRLAEVSRCLERINLKSWLSRSQPYPPTSFYSCNHLWF